MSLAGPFFDGTATPMVATIALRGAIAFAFSRWLFRPERTPSRPASAAG